MPSMLGPESSCVGCNQTSFVEGGFGVAICLHCGLGKSGTIACFGTTHWGQDRVLPKQCYTRRKRFKKYLHRAMRMQSATTIPEETWKYLFAHGPYHDAKHVQRVLKQAHLKRKCYDSLPYLTATLCSHVHVPRLTEMEKAAAMRLFERIDTAITSGPFVSYLYCLEYILERMGRSDVCKHINQIKCPKRRAAYKIRLNAIFKVERPNIMLRLRKPV